MPSLPFARGGNLPTWESAQADFALLAGAVSTALHADRVQNVPGFGACGQPSSRTGTLWPALSPRRFSHVCQEEPAGCRVILLASKSMPVRKTAQAQVNILCAAATSADFLALPRATRRV